MDNTLISLLLRVDYVVVYLVSNAGRAGSKWIHENDIPDLINSAGTWIIGSGRDKNFVPE